MKMIDGFFSLALLNKALMSFSLSPTYLLMRSEEDTEKKVPSASVAQALAKKVLPVPGGPYNRIPFHGFLLPVKISLNLIGRITAYFNAFLAFYRPDTSYHLTFGFYVTIASLICPFKLLSSLLPFPDPPPPPPPVATFCATYFPLSLFLSLPLSSFSLSSYEVFTDSID
jgi:hypothetical protein